MKSTSARCMWPQASETKRLLAPRGNQESLVPANSVLDGYGEPHRLGSCISPHSVAALLPLHNSGRNARRAALHCCRGSPVLVVHLLSRLACCRGSLVVVVGLL